MRDSEFYRGPEDWPQPEDDSCTLAHAGGTTISLKKRLNKNSAKAKKKMSESLAGATATVVAAAVLVGALPEVLPICPVCQRTSVECVYFDPQFNDESLGLAVYLDTPVTFVDTDDHYAMPGFTADDRDYAGMEGGIQAADGRRLALHVSQEAKDNYTSVSQMHQNIWGASYADEQMTGLVLFQEGSYSQQQAFYLAALVSEPWESPVAAVTDYIEQSRFANAIDISSPDVECIELPVEGFSNVYLTIFTNVPALKSRPSLVWVEVLPAPGMVQPLGKTMTLTEKGLLSSDSLFRTYDDSYYSGFGANYSRGDDLGRYLFKSFDHKEYELISNTQGLIEVEFAGTSWHNIFDKWQKLNAEAPKYGHEVSFPVLPLNTFKCNGITYDHYVVVLDWFEGSEQFLYTIEHYYIPAQESNIAFVTQETIPQQQYEQLMDSEHTRYTGSKGHDFLKHITLR